MRFSKYEAYRANFERLNNREVERKYLPTDPEALQPFREQSRPIEQFYLSSPDEPFSLRFREELDKNGDLVYTATLKDRGKMSPSGLDRLEIETNISPELYDYYKTPELPCLKKLRSDLGDGVVIDYYEDGHIQVESEDSYAWKQFSEYMDCDFIDITEEEISNNEFRANQVFQKQEIYLPELDPAVIVKDILKKLKYSENNVVRICGRSGSGKSTVSRQVQQMLDSLSIASDVVSTDDYNRGSSWLRSFNNGLDWSEWDHPIVYDTKTMAADLQKLQQKQSIPRRSFDFVTQEPVFGDEISPVPVVIVEGIYALSPDFENLDSLKYEVPTPLATCVGRRLLRDIKERPTFASPSLNLRYMLEQTEPMYRKQLNK